MIDDASTCIALLKKLIHILHVFTSFLQSPDNFSVDFDSITILITGESCFNRAKVGVFTTRK